MYKHCTCRTWASSVLHHWLQHLDLVWEKGPPITHAYVSPQLPHKFILNSCDKKTIPMLFHQVFLVTRPKMGVFSFRFWVLSLFGDRGAVPNGWQIAAYKADFIRGDDHVQSSVWSHRPQCYPWSAAGRGLELIRWLLSVEPGGKWWILPWILSTFQGLVMDFEGIFPAFDVFGLFGSICGRDGEASRRWHKCSKLSWPKETYVDPVAL